MADLIAGANSPKRSIKRIAIGCLLFLYLGLCLAGIFLINQQTGIHHASTSMLTPSAAATPLLLAHQPKDEKTLRFDDFSSGIRNWTLYYPPGKLELVDEKLLLQSYKEDGISIATRGDFFAPATDKYYIQADFTTDSKTFSPYGLVFGFDYSLGTFYAFEMLRATGTVYLKKHGAGGWEVLVPNTPASLNPYPEVNTLSVYFNQGAMELFTNGKLIAAYSDDNVLQSKNFGVLVGRGDYRLIVDNIFIYNDR